jgi:hypothetical protein
MCKQLNAVMSKATKLFDRMPVIITLDDFHFGDEDDQPHKNLIVIAMEGDLIDEESIK